MWHMINTINDLKSFMETMCYFHDSCIKELKYVSGAYVDKDLSMYPINDRRALSVVIHRQFQDSPVIEMLFEGLKCLQLVPVDEQFTCEILDSTMILKNNLIYWIDCGAEPDLDLDSYSGNMICASKLRWRSIGDSLGPEEFYLSLVT